NVLFPCESRYQHQKRRFREVEVRDQSIQQLKLKSWIDKDIRPSAACSDRSVKAERCGFDRPAARRPDTDDAAAGSFRAAYDLGRFFCHFIKFRMHMVLRHIFYFHRTE